MCPNLLLVYKIKCFSDGTSCIYIFVLSLNILNAHFLRRYIKLISRHFILLVINLSIVVDRDPCIAWC